jgi:hypothetical protein
MQMDTMGTTVPVELTKAKTCELLKESNDYAFDKATGDLKNKLNSADFMMVPVIISCLAHDFIKINYEFEEDTFRAAIHKH